MAIVSSSGPEASRVSPCGCQVDKVVVVINPTPLLMPLWLQYFLVNVGRHCLCVCVICFVCYLFFKCYYTMYHCVCQCEIIIT